MPHFLVEPVSWEQSNGIDSLSNVYGVDHNTIDIDIVYRYRDKCIDNVSIPTAVKYRDIDTKLFRIETVSMNYEPLADIDRTYSI